MVTHPKSFLGVCWSSKVCPQGWRSPRWLARKPWETSELPSWSKWGKSGQAGFQQWSQWQKQNGTWEPESQEEACEWWGGSSVTPVTTTSVHHKHKVTLKKIFKCCNTSRVWYEKSAGGEEGEREVRQSRMQGGTEFSGWGRPIFSKEQEEREKTAEGIEDSRRGREIGKEFASAASGGLEEQLLHRPARNVTVALCWGSQRVGIGSKYFPRGDLTGQPSGWVYCSRTHSRPSLRG